MPPYSGQVNVTFKRRDFRDTWSTAALQTDADGRLTLGTLEGIATLTAWIPNGVGRTWNFTSDRHSPNASIHAVAGETLAVPAMGEQRVGEPVELCLGERPLDEVHRRGIDLRRRSLHAERLGVAARGGAARIQLARPRADLDAMDGLGTGVGYQGVPIVSPTRVLGVSAVCIRA